MKMTLEQKKKELEEYIEELMKTCNIRYEEIVEALKEQGQYGTPYGDRVIEEFNERVKKYKEAFTYGTSTSREMIDDYFGYGVWLEKREWIEKDIVEGYLSESAVDSYNSLENKTDILIYDSNHDKVRSFSEDDFISIAKNAFEYWTHID